MNGAVALPLDLPELSLTASGDALVRRSVLPSGIRILSERVPGARSATIGFWVAVGSRDELGAVSAADVRDGAGAHGLAAAALPSRFGSTHFLEHLLFKGTPGRTALDIAVAFDEVGGEHNALTGKEYTCYYAKVQDRDLPMAVSVLADMFTSSVLDAAEFENERGVILEELAMADDDPNDVVGERLFEAVLGDHPLGRPIGGTNDTIRAVTRDAVWQHYLANYRPNDLVVTVAGAVDHDELVALVIAAVDGAGWELTKPARPVERRLGSSAPVTRGSALSITNRPNEQAVVMLGYPGLVATDDRRTTLSVLNSVFGGGMSSRLFQEIREKRGLAYSVYSYGAGYSDAGLFGMYAGCSPKNAAQVSELMLAEFDLLARDGISVGELARAKGQLSGSAALSLEDSDTRMSRLGRSEITTGEFADLDEGLRRLDAVTVDDVQQLAASLIAGSLSIAAVGALEASTFDRVVQS
ncbi:M16 family metallopeptidase [Subtercola boreus]|uniref:Peptidase M16 n=1 Tax=Subtercola boreus TaxID=120213 RepID=A0A3E0WBZ6_9MICO|nr:pitrilysin family protein [Subtercola boreus]RFA20605.1 peptidase M16 [Subtercola boreus]RFA20754.1 peptidase M16 [Subtercola boreus]RFA26930.1 peptidase M16 [Subtercola boreus]